MISPSHRPLPSQHNTTQTQRTNIPALSGIPTLKPGNRAPQNYAWNSTTTVLSLDTLLIIPNTLKLCSSLRMSGEAFYLLFHIVTSTADLTLLLCHKTIQCVAVLHCMGVLQCKSCRWTNVCEDVLTLPNVQCISKQE